MAVPQPAELEISGMVQGLRPSMHQLDWFLANEMPLIFSPTHAKLQVGCSPAQGSPRAMSTQDQAAHSQGEQQETHAQRGRNVDQSDVIVRKDSNPEGPVKKDARDATVTTLNWPDMRPRP